jgi:hypothetical protein
MDKSKSEAAQGRVRYRCFQEENSMSSPVPFINGSATPAPNAIASTPPPSASGARRAGVSFPLAPPQPAVSLETFPASPPSEVLDQMAGAARTHDALHAQGRELHFAHDEASGRIEVEVRDAGGNVLRTISPSEALRVAAGKPLE